MLNQKPRVEDQVQLDIPTVEEPVARPTPRYGARTVTAVLGVAALIAVAALVWNVIDGGTTAEPIGTAETTLVDDGSFQVAEDDRLEGLRPTGLVTDPFEAAEYARQQRIGQTAPATDGSNQTAEDARFQNLAPTDSFDAAELGRMMRLAPTETSDDGSFQAAEDGRLGSLAPPPAEGDEFEIAEYSRMLRLSP